MGKRTLRAEELSRDVEGLAAHYNDLLTIEQLLRDRAGQATEQVALSVNDLAAVSNVLSQGRRRELDVWRLWPTKKAYVQ